METQNKVPGENAVSGFPPHRRVFQSWSIAPNAVRKHSPDFWSYQQTRDKSWQPCSRMAALPCNALPFVERLKGTLSMRGSNSSAILFIPVRVIINCGLQNLSLVSTSFYRVDNVRFHSSPRDALKSPQVGAIAKGGLPILPAVDTYLAQHVSQILGVENFRQA